jgi:hypothetical protein
VSEAKQAKAKRNVGSKVASTVLVFMMPILLLAIIGTIGGGVGIGMVELTLLWAIWLVGLAWVGGPDEVDVASPWALNVMPLELPAHRH